MCVRTNGKLTPEEINSLVRQVTGPIDEQYQDYVAAIPHRVPLPPAQEPAHQALMAGVAQKLINGILLDNDIDTLVPTITKLLPEGAEVDEITLRRLVREMLKGRRTQLAEQVSELSTMADRRPVGPEPFDGLKIHYSVEIDPGDEMSRQILDEARTAKVGDLSQYHDRLQKLVQEELAAGRFTTGEEIEAEFAARRAVPSVASPPITSGAVKPLGPPISKCWAVLIDAIIKDGDWAEDSDAQARSTLAMLVNICGDRPLDSYTFDDGDRLRSVVLALPNDYFRSERWRELFERGQFEAIAQQAKAAIDAGEDIKTLSKKTWNRHYGVLNKIWPVAFKRRMASTAKCPFVGLHINTKTWKSRQEQAAKQREMLTSEEIATLFSAPLFVGAKSRSGWKHPGLLVFADERYWGPLVAAYTGMRLGEVAQIRVRFVKNVGDVWYIDLLTPDEMIDVKEAGSPRLVPLHSDLLRLGLLESRVFNRNPDDLLIFDEVLTGSPRQQRLQFKSLASRQGGFFSRFKAHYGLPAHKKTLHSFRHSVQTFLQRAEVADGIISAIIGHTDERRPEVKASYDHGYTLQQLKPAIEKLVLPIDVDLLVKARNGRMRGETR